MKQEIDFIKFNPTQNMTVLVKTDHPAETYPHIAAQIMSYDNVYAEQVGFIGEQKAGGGCPFGNGRGEFCGNACMALAAYIASEEELESYEFTEIMLEVSGTDQLIRCQVKKQQQNEYFCQVTMPVPQQIERRTIKYEGTDMDMVIVRYREFIHIVIEVETFDEAMRKRAQALARLLGLTLGIS
ncbi:hypothetical protein [Paenibacillus sp. 1A_MP2]|uniref:hypothetical protein n=1 Tax=Paenibacillus sp. 1A_MP2 TaxID=3457495 RepID=UPI003FCD188C